MSTPTPRPPETPRTPRTLDELRAALRDLQGRDLPAHGGHTLAYVYDAGLADAEAIGLEALAMFAGSNGLDPTAFPSILTMENDLVALAGELLDAPTGFVGTVSSGGTESILLAVLAARDGAGCRAGAASMVLPSTAHAAFLKAAHYFGVEAIVVDVDPTTFRARPEAMAAAVRDDTVLLVASAPSYAQGVIDPIPAIAAIAAERGLRCHVDACIGGWVLPFLAPSTPWTFAVEGVTSISVDLHKYAYTPKGVSVVLHRDSRLRKGHFFAAADWPGYTMLNTTTQSTKSGGPVAAAWAVTSAIGTDGYAGLARTARDAALAIASGVEGAAGAPGIPGLRVLVAPDSTLLALTADDSCDVFTIADEMLLRGWYVQPQMAYRDMPASLHLTLSAATAPAVPDFLVALAESVTAARRAGPVRVDPDLAAAAAALDPSTLTDEDFDGLLVLAGLAGSGGEGSGSVGLALPERMAPVNALLEVAPPRLREALLLAFLDRLSRPTSRAEDARHARSS